MNPQFLHRYFPRRLRHAFAATLIALLAACAMPSAIVVNSTTADELVQRLGQPTDKRSAPQSAEQWDYAYGPEGTETWRFLIDQTRRVRSATQLLTEERLHQIKQGATEAEVLDMLGRPRNISTMRGETAWEWRVRLPPQFGTYVVRFSPDKRVVGINVLVDFMSDNDRDSGP